MKIGLVSLGCPKNLVDSETMLGLIHEQQITITNDPAAIYLLKSPVVPEYYKQY